MKESDPESVSEPLDVVTRLVHLGLVLFGIAAWLTGELAEDYSRIDASGYQVHSWLGFGLAGAIGLRIFWGFIGPAAIRFRSWVPYTAARIREAGRDVLGLLRFRLPDRPTHSGLSGLVQTFGLVIFAWMSLTGVVLYAGISPGRESSWFVEAVEELHEIGESLIPLYLFIHVGAVLLHALAGKPVWKKMFFIRDRT